MRFFKYKKPVIKSEKFKPYEPWKKLDEFRDIESKEGDRDNPCAINTQEPKDPPETMCPGELWGHRITYWDEEDWVG